MNSHEIKLIGLGVFVVICSWPNEPPNGHPLMDKIIKWSPKHEINTYCQSKC